MAIFKGFRVQIVDGITPNANVIADLGSFAYPFLEYSRDIPTGSIYPEYPTYLNQYTDDASSAGGVNLTGNPENSDWITNFNLLLEMAPLSVNRTIYGQSLLNNYVRFLNGSGKYALSGKITGSAGSGTVADLYDENGNRVNSFNLAVFEFGYDTSTPRVTCITVTSSGGVISRTRQNIRFNPFNNRYYIVVSNQDTTNTDIINWLNGLEAYVPPPTDPYTQGGESDTGGGTGNFDGTSVDVDFTSLPTLSAVDTGFITLYNPTVTQLQALASYMWSGAFDLDTFKKLFADPMQAILGLSIVPGPVPSSGSQAVKVGNISTGISMTKAASQYIDVDCGTLNVEEFWGAYLDYEPYTKAEIYLPYIGTHQIAVDDIMGKAVHIKYHIDILSGACAAEIKCGGSVLYTFIGSVAVSIPVTGNDWTNVINGVLSIAGAVGSLVATGGASAPAAAGEIASAAVNSLKPNIEKSGAVSGGGGLMSGKVPVLILTRPRQALPTSQNEFTGYPAFITRSLGAVSGYTEVHKIRLGGISATDAELDEIENLLKGGVIL